MNVFCRWIGCGEGCLAHKNTPDMKKPAVLSAGG
jgi:hypothetical protein